MRCKNCGWDNPAGNVKCEKCNALLGDSMVEERTPQYGYAPEGFNPRVTMPGLPPDDFNPQSTAMGCAMCGYPVRLSDPSCPVCGHSATGSGKEAEKAEDKKPVMAGTIIQGVDYDRDKTDGERKKLTGFLVTYSRSPNGEFFPLYEGKNLIGRSASSHVHIQDDSSVSEKHLSILYRAVDRKFKFKDEQSSNGTFINENLLDEGELKNYDVIRIGATRLLFMEIPLSFLE